MRVVLVVGGWMICNFTYFYVKNNVLYEAIFDPYLRDEKYFFILMIKTDETKKLSPVLHQPLLLVWTKVMVNTIS